jgi:hypothetical protein
MLLVLMLRFCDRENSVVVVVVARIFAGVIQLDNQKMIVIRQFSKTYHNVKRCLKLAVQTT